MVNLHHVLVILLITFCLKASGRSGVNTRNARRLANVEHRLDTITADISVFRLDMRDIWDTLDTHNEVNKTEDTSPAVSETAEKETKVRNERIYSALQKEKQFTRDFMRDIEKKFTNFESETNMTFHQMIEQTRTELHNKVEIVQQKVVNAVNDLKTEYISLLKETKQQLQDLTLTFSKTTESLEINHEQFNQLEEENKRCQLTITDKNNEISKLKLQLQDVDSLTAQLQKTIQELENRCPIGWYQHKRSCYFLSSFTATWDNAMSWCRRNHGYLVEYSDKDELKVVVDLVKVISKWDKKVWTGFWTGADDIKHEGQWKWSRSGKNLTFAKWKTHQPDNGSGTEDCMVTLVNLNGQWNDEQCYVHYKFVCERML